MDAGWMLRVARAHAGLSQRAVAERVGVAQSTVARIEGGHVDPLAGTLDRLLRACGFELGLQLAREDAAGVDRSLIREQLGRPPTERVRSMVQASEFAQSVRSAHREAAG
jgi:transcriptional regulator with XRE-family HTH domain